MGTRIMRWAALGCATWLSSAVAMAADTVAPTVPTNLNATSVTSSSITACWSASTDNVAVTGYQAWLGNTAVSLSASTLCNTFSSLLSGTSYNLTVRARDAAGNWSALAPVLAVKTTAVVDTSPPTTPGAISLSNITSTGATVSWGASTDNVAVAGYQLWVGNSHYLLSASSLQYTVTGLLAGSSYNLAVRAEDGAGNWSALTPVVKLTTAGVISPPTTPGNVTASAIGSTGFTLNWTASTDAVAVTGYQVWIGNSAYSVAANATSYAVTGLTSGKSYNATVRATDAAGNWSPLAPVVVVTTTTPDTIPPTTPGAVTFSAIGNTGFTVSWGASTDNVGVDHYVLTAGSTSVNVPGSNTSYTASGLTAGTSYSVTVKAVDAAGNSSATTTPASVTTTSPDTTPPTTPGAVTISAITATGFTVNWGASTDNVGVDHYLVTIGSSSVSVAAANTSYVATGLTTGTAYSVTVKAYDAAGNASTATTAVSATPVNPGNTAVIYYDNTSSWTTVNIHYGINSTWTTPPGVAMTLGCTGYWTKTISLGTATSMAADFNNGTTWDNNGGNNYTINAGTTVVKSGVVTSNAASPCAPDTTPPTTPGAVVASAITATGFTATWTASTDNVGVDHYIVSVGSTNITVAGTATSTVVTGLTAATTYSVTVKAYDAAGNASTASTATSVTTSIVDTTPPSVPAGLSATASSSACSVTLAWTASTDNVGVTGYNVLRNGTKIGTSTTAGYADSTVVAATSYSYTVSAYDAAGNTSAASTAASVTTISSCAAPAFTLGVMYTSTASTFSVWSPDTSNVVLYLNGSTYPMTHIADTNGYTNVYSVTVPGDWNLKQYNFQINGVTARDPYGVMVVPGTNYDVVIDPSQTNLPNGWSATPAFNSRDDAIIYEMHVRDFTISPTSGVPTAQAGTFAAMTLAGTTVNGTAGAPSTGIDHLVDMGVTHIQILPMYDFGSCNPTQVAANPSCYNWGYDPVNYNVPEWRYSLTPNDYLNRVKEFKAMVDGFHKRGIRVIMDVVYNHTYTKDVLSNITGQYYTATDLSGTGNSLNGEVPMVSRMIQDSLEYWVTQYNIDGFRFDLLGVFDAATAGAWGTYLNTKYPSRNLLMYGEPWNGTGTDPLEPQRVRFSTIGTIVGSHVGVFNGEYRTALKGDDNDGSGGGYLFNQGTVWGSTWAGTSLGEGPISVGMKASPRAVQGTGNLTNIWDPMFSMAPEQSINYVDVHDNLCLADKISAWAALNGQSSNTAYLARLQQFALSIILTSEGIPLIDGGAEFQRSKNGDSNSYASPDSTNEVNWNLLTTNAATYAYTKDLIALRKAHSGLRMTSWTQVNSNVQSDQRNASLVFTQINAAANSDTWNQELVIFNSGADTVVTLPSGNWTVAVEQSSPTAGVGSVVSGTVTASGTAATVLHQ